jgi:hypothetical protein
MSFNTSITGGPKCPTFTFNSTTVEATNGVFENVTATNGNFVNLTGTTFNPSNITTNILSANVGNIIDFTSTDATLTTADINTAFIDIANVTTANVTDITIDSLEVENGTIDNQLIINDTIDTGLTTPNSSIQRRTGTLNINLGYLDSSLGIPVPAVIDIRRFYRTSGQANDSIISSDTSGLVTIPNLATTSITVTNDLTIQNDLTLEHDVFFRTGGNVIADIVQTPTDIALELDPSVNFFIKPMGGFNINSLIQVYPSLNKVIIPNLEAGNGEIPYFQTNIVDVINRWNFTGSKNYNLISITADPVLDKTLYDIRTNGLLSFRNLQTQQEILNIDTTNNRTIAPNITTNEITFQDSGTAYSTLEQTATELDLLLDTDFTISTSATELMRASESGGYVLFPSLQATAATITTGTIPTLNSDNLTINTNLIYDLTNNITAGNGINFTNVTASGFTIESNGGIPANPTFSSVTTTGNVAVGGDISTTDITVSGLLTATDADITSSLTATSAFLSGNLNMINSGSINTNGGINLTAGSGITMTGTPVGGNLNTTGNVLAGDVTATNVTGDTVRSYGDTISDGNLTILGNASIAGTTTTKRIQYNPSSLFWQVSGNGPQPGSGTSQLIDFDSAIWDKTGGAFGRIGVGFLVNASGWYKCSAHVQFRKISGTNTQTIRSYFTINGAWRPDRGATFSSTPLLTNNARFGNTSVTNTIFFEAGEEVTVAYQAANQPGANFGSAITSVVSTIGSYIYMEYLGGTFTF